MCGNPQWTNSIADSSFKALVIPLGTKSRSNNRPRAINNCFRPVLTFVVEGRDFTPLAPHSEFIGQVFLGLKSEEAEKKFVAENRPTSLIAILIDPKEIGDVVAFVSSPLASAINGGSGAG